MTDVQTAFCFTIMAGLSTGIGSLIAFFVKEKSLNLLSLAMSFAAGVMLYVSFAEILPEATHLLAESFGGVDEHSEGHHQAEWMSMLAFFVGMLIVFLIERIMPSEDAPHDLEKIKEDGKEIDASKLKKIGVLTALALAIHNFPEGAATFVAALEDPTLGFAIAMAIALHNIPEGIAVSMPIYYATGDRKQAFMYSFVSGLVEPLGAFLCYFLLGDYLTPAVMGYLLAAVGGIMVFISLEQLIPVAKKYGGDSHITTYGVVTGMFIMAISLLLLH